MYYIYDSGVRQFARGGSKVNQFFQVDARLQVSYAFRTTTIPFVHIKDVAG